MIIETKKKIFLTIFLFTVTYMVSYITRIDYGAVILEMVRSTGQSKSALSAAITGSFITYGVGQIISGICGDKLPPKYLVLVGLTVSSIMNILIPFCISLLAMVVVWCINGFAQSFMWPPLVRLMTSLFSEKDYEKSSVRVSWGSSFGTVFVYLVAPLLISVWNWKSVFWCAAGLGLLMAVVWFFFCPNVAPEPNGKKEESINKKDRKKYLFLSPLSLAIMFAIVLQGSLRDGVTTWMPTYISETFDLSSSISILTGVVLPLFSILSFQVASVLYRKKFNNPLTCSLLFFGIGALSALFLYFFSDTNYILSVILSALLTGCMHAINLLLICMVPAYFKKYGNVSTASGLFNSCTYIGSAVSTYGIALLSENTGWKITLLVWFLIACVGAVLCFLFAPVWKKKKF